METKYILAGVVLVLWIVVRFWLMRRRSARIRQLREQAPAVEDGREAEGSDAADDGKMK